MTTVYVVYRCKRSYLHQAIHDGQDELPMLRYRESQPQKEALAPCLTSTV